MDVFRFDEKIPTQFIFDQLDQLDLQSVDQRQLEQVKYNLLGLLDQGMNLRVCAIQSAEEPGTTTCQVFTLSAEQSNGVITFEISEIATSLNVLKGSLKIAGAKLPINTIRAANTAAHTKAPIIYASYASQDHENHLRTLNTIMLPLVPSKIEYFGYVASAF